jgi:hypothetical protein
MHEVREHRLMSFRRRPESRLSEHKLDPGLRRDDGVLAMRAYGSPLKEGEKLFMQLP